MSLGENIRTLREAVGLTQTQLGIAVNGKGQGAVAALSAARAQQIAAPQEPAADTPLPSPLPKHRKTQRHRRLRRVS